MARIFNWHRKTTVAKARRLGPYPPGQKEPRRRSAETLCRARKVDSTVGHTRAAAELERALFGTELSFRSAPAMRDNVPQGRRQTQVAVSSYEAREEPGGREVS